MNDKFYPVITWRGILIEVTYQDYGKNGSAYKAQTIVNGKHYHYSAGVSWGAIVGLKYALQDACKFVYITCEYDNVLGHKTILEVSMVKPSNVETFEEASKLNDKFLFYEIHVLREV